MSVLWFVFVLACFGLCMRVIASAVSNIGARKEVSPYRIKYIVKTINLALLPFFLILATSLLGLEYSQIVIFLSSIFAVVGVALFAQWSILSNITASLIIFFGFPYRVGDYIRVVENDQDISGVVEEITLFHVLIKKGDEIITYPNSLILQKPVIKLPKEPQAAEASTETVQEK